MSTGAEFIGEGFIFGVVVAVTAWEYQQSSAKSAVLPAASLPSPVLVAATRCWAGACAEGLLGCGGVVWRWRHGCVTLVWQALGLASVPHLVAVSLLCLCAYGIRPGMYVWHALTSGHVRGWRGQVEKEKAAAKEEEMKKRIEIKETRLASVESRLAVCASPLPPRPPASLCHGTDPARAYVGHGCKGMGGSSGGQARASGCTL